MSLLGHDQRSCEHTPKVLSFLVVMLTLLVMLMFTSRFPIVTAAERLRK